MNIIKRLKNIEQIKPRNIKEAIVVAKDKDQDLLKWSASFETRHNFGDALNPWLFEKITGKTPKNGNNILNITNRPVFSAIGSILDNNKTQNLNVWGSGFKREGARFIVKPKKVHAVRGPLSRENILKLGIECPEIYGDPALLLPRYYNPKIEKQYKLGILAHYIDKNNDNYINLKSQSTDNILIIDIEDTIENVVDNILKCEKVASSSLHGIIVSDAYKVPSRQIKFSDNIAGGNFKFKDYMASVKRQFKDPLVITNETTIIDVIESFYDYDIEIDLDRLLEHCPFPC